MLEKSCGWWLIWYFLFFCHGGAEATESRPYIDPNITQSSKVMSPQGQPLVINCGIDGFPKPLITWYKSLEVRAPDDRVRVLSNGSLHFMLLTKGDQAYYYCHGKNDLGQVKSAEIFVEVAYIKSRFEQEPNSQYIRGKSRTLPCSPPASHPPANVTWYKDKQPMKYRTGEHAAYILDPAESIWDLFFTDIQKQDEGGYFCIASNNFAVPMSRTSKSADIQIEGQLQWVVKEKVTDYGQNLTLFCPVKNCCNEGAGWSVRSKTLLDVKAFSNNSNVKYHGTYNTDGFGVVIRNLSEADLNVTYRCVYDFNWSTPKYLLHGDVFKESTEVPDKDKENDTAAIVGYIFGAGAGIYIVGGIIIGIIAYCMRRKNKKQKLKDTSQERQPFIGPINRTENQQDTSQERQPFIGPINRTENQQDTIQERQPFIGPINRTENQQDTSQERQPFIGPINRTENQQGTGEESKSLTDSINLTENQQDVAEAESNTVKHSDAQVLIESHGVEGAMQNSPSPVERELRIALVGKTGVGKSATANTICGGNYFKSDIYAQSVTKICQQQKVTRLGKDISIIDTPGIFDGTSDQSYVEREIRRCVHLGAPGLHAILFVMEIGRFTQENIDVIHFFLKFFEKEMKNRMIVVFTHADILLQKNASLLDFIKTTPTVLKSFLKSCENRAILFNNEIKEEQSDKQVGDILEMIKALKRANEIGFYTDVKFDKAEKSVQEREEVIRNELEMEYKAKIEKYESTMQIQIQKGVIEEFRKEYEKLLDNVREMVRNEIKSKENTCTIQ